MKIYFKHPNGWEFRYERQPMDSDKFYALVALAAGALFVLWLVAGAALK